jgi:hypothetical protein
MRIYAEVTLNKEFPLGLGLGETFCPTDIITYILFRHIHLPPTDTYIGREGEVKVAPRFTVASSPYRTSLYLMARIHGPSLALPWRSFTLLTVSSVYPDGTLARCRVCEDLGVNRLSAHSRVL